MGPSESEIVIVDIWERFLDCLKSSALEKSDRIFEIVADANVEHVQLLLFLFHSLQLMQKKSVLIKAAEVIISVSSQNIQ